MNLPQTHFITNDDLSIMSSLVTTLGRDMRISNIKRGYSL